VHTTGPWLSKAYASSTGTTTIWYSSWYNGLAKKHIFNIKRAKDLTREIIVYCKANQQRKVIQAIDVVFKAKRSASVE
jgi:hypothetical protein